MYDSWDEGSQLKEYPYKITGGTGKISRRQRWGYLYLRKPDRHPLRRHVQRRDKIAISRACIRGGAACDLSLEAKKAGPFGGRSGPAVDAEGGCVQGTMLVARLLCRDGAYSFRRTSVEAERGRDRRMHDPSIADIQPGSKVRVVIECSQASAGELDHERQRRVVEGLCRRHRDSARHVGHAIMNDPIDFEGRIGMRRGP